MKTKQLTEAEVKLLELEYGYIKTTIEQTIDDRYKLLSFYIGVGSTVATILVGILTFGSGDQTGSALFKELGIAALAIVMWMVGVLFTLMFVRLRQAWHSAVTSLNKIKAFMVANSQNDLGEAIRWTQDKLPALDKWWNIHFYSVVMINIVSGIFFSAFCVLTTLHAFAITWAIVFGVVGFIANMMFGMSLYLWLVRR